MGGLETCRADSRAVGDRHHHADGARQRNRQGRSARCRRRRLRDQAVQHARAAGAHSRGAAPRAVDAGHRHQPSDARRRSTSTSTRGRSPRRRPARASDAERIRRCCATSPRTPTRRSRIASCCRPSGDPTTATRSTTCGWSINQLRKKIEAHPPKPVTCSPSPGSATGSPCRCPACRIRRLNEILICRLMTS